MLSGVKLVSKEEAERLDAKDKKQQKKDHKREKKHKKHSKKDKKDRRDDRDRSNSSDSEPDSPRPAAVHNVPDIAPGGRGNDGKPAPPLADTQPVEPSVQREDWMTVPMGRPVVGEPAEKDAGVGDEKLNVSARELNPDMQSGEAKPVPVPTSTQPAGAIGDGGASWRLKALRRAQAQAGEEGKNLNEVVSERWGSLNELAAGITDSRAAHSMAHAHAARDRRRHEEGEEDRGPSRKDGKYLKDVRSAKSQMRRPSEQDLSVSWQRRGGSRASGGESGSGTESRRRQSRGQSDDAAVLAAAAPELNNFANDGSFLNQFAQVNEASGNPKKDSEAGNEAPRREEREERREQEQRRREPREHEREKEEEEEEGLRGTHRDTSNRRPPLFPSSKPLQNNEEDRQERRPISLGGDNLSAAAALRARLGGKKAPATSAAPAGQPRDETVALPLIDASGRAAPGAFGRDSAGAAEDKLRPMRRTERYESGEKKRYYADDDSADLATLVKRTKYEGAADIDANMARNIARKSRFRESDLDADAEYDHDAGLELADGRRAPSKDARRRGSAAEEVAVREKARQVRDYNKLTSALDRCSLCFSSAGRIKHLTLAIGNSAYLALPPRGRLVPGHCQIIPAEHVATTRAADENTWTEVRNFKKCLLRMFAAQGLDVVFFETAPRPGDVRAHAVVDCVPLPPRAASKAPMYFRKAIEDATNEWAQHAAKRFIDTSVKGLRGAIPPNFPYFHVEFGLGSGFVHVMDDPETFDRDLARSVLVGLLDLPQEDMHRRAKRESEGMQVQWVREFREKFDEFDWTKAL